MSTYADQWHKSEDGAWHVWQKFAADGSADEKSPPGDLPMCGSDVTVTADEFGAAVTLDDMCPVCRDHHMGA